MSIALIIMSAWIVLTYRKYGETERRAQDREGRLFMLGVSGEAHKVRHKRNVKSRKKWSQKQRKMRNTKPRW